VDLNGVVDGALLLLHNSLKQGVEVVDERGDLPPVLGDASALGSIVINLIENARQALGGQGRLFVRTAVRDGAVVLTVADDGPGLSECRQERERVFEPGFTTKDADEGTGLGLFIARRIASGHGGTLTAANRDGGGAEFTLELPAAPEDKAGG
jgi:two-component system sensor histidine kinase HupT/HoxJ